jgi:hypothetical protein
MAIAIVAIATGLGRRLLFHGTTVGEIVFGAVVVLLLVSYAIYELFENKIKASCFYKTRERSLERKSRFVDELFLLIGGIALAVGLFLYDPTNLWLRIGRLFIIVISMIGVAVFSWRVYAYLCGRDVRDGVSN